MSVSKTVWGRSALLYCLLTQIDDTACSENYWLRHMGPTLTAITDLLPFLRKGTDETLSLWPSIIYGTNILTFACWCEMMHSRNIFIICLPRIVKWNLSYLENFLINSCFDMVLFRNSTYVHFMYYNICESLIWQKQGCDFHIFDSLYICMS